MAHEVPAHPKTPADALSDAGGATRGRAPRGRSVNRQPAAAAPGRYGRAQFWFLRSFLNLLFHYRGNFDNRRHYISYNRLAGVEKFHFRVITPNIIHMDAVSYLEIAHINFK